MRAALLLALALLSLASRAGAGEPLHLTGAALGPDGRITRNAADVMGNDEPSYTPLLVIDAPVLRGAERITGRVETFQVDGEAWLELASVFADGHRDVNRTRDAGGTRLAGTSETRPFALAVPSAGEGPAPVRVELGVGMLGPGVVSVSALRLEGAGPGAASAVAIRGARVGLVILVGAALAVGPFVALRRRMRARLAAR